MPSVTKESAAAVDEAEKVASQDVVEDTSVGQVEPRKAEKLFRDLIQLDDELQSHGLNVRQVLAATAKTAFGVSVAHHAPTDKELEIAAKKAA